MSAPKGSSRARPATRTPKRGSAEAAPAKKKKRSPLRQITAKKVKPPRNVPIGPVQIRHLRGLGHALKPVVQVGKAGVTPGLIDSTVAQLNAHELIKVKIGDEDREVRREQAELLARETGAVLAEVLGRTVLLYKRHPKTPRLVLPTGRSEKSDAPADAVRDEDDEDEDLGDDDDADDSDDDADDEY